MLVEAGECEERSRIRVEPMGEVDGMRTPLIPVEIQDESTATRTESRAMLTTSGSIRTFTLARFNGPPGPTRGGVRRLREALATGLRVHLSKPDP